MYVRNSVSDGTKLVQLGALVLSLLFGRWVFLWSLRAVKGIVAGTAVVKVVANFGALLCM